MDGGIGESLLLENVLTGAAVGGGLSLLTGGNPLQGALMGGLGGGIKTKIGDWLKTGASTTGAGFNQAAALQAPQVSGSTGIGSLLTPEQKAFSFTPWENQPAGQIGGWDPTAGVTTPDTSRFTPIDTTGAPSYSTAPTPVQAAVQNIQAQAAPQANYNTITGEPIRNLADSRYNVGQPVAPQEQSFFQKYQTPIILGGGALGLAALTQKPKGLQPLPGPNVPQFGLASTYQPVPNPVAVYPGRGYAEGGIAALADGGRSISQPANVDFMGGDMYPMSQQQRSFYASPTQMPTSAQQAMASYEPKTNPLTGTPTANMAGGGIADIQTEAMYKRLTSDLPQITPTASAKGGMLKGPGDGMSDSIPGTISGGGAVRPARLADGEFVVPADVVSHLGNVSTDAGAKQLYAMMDKVRKARTGTKKQGKQINPRKMMPA